MAGECMFIIGGDERSVDRTFAYGRITALLRDLGRNLLRNTLTWLGSTRFLENRALINL